MRHIGSRGFTLIELLVVVGMIVLLATILLPMVNHARTQAMRTSMAADLMVISQALEAYKGDFGFYPQINRNPSPNQPAPNAGPLTGAALLCWALVAPGPAISPNSVTPGDGADGPGFRLRGTVGPIKGPYLPPDRFLIGTVDGGGMVHTPNTIILSPGQKAAFNDNEDVLADRSYSPILYFAVTKGALANSSPNGFVKAVYVPPPPAGDPPIPAQNPAVFIFDDNHVYMDVSHLFPYNEFNNGNPNDLTRGLNKIGWRVMSYRLGDSNYNGVIDPSEVPVTTGPYLLWSPGPDQYFGDDDDVMCDGTQLQQVTGMLPHQIMPNP